MAELGGGLPAAAARPGLALLADTDGAVGTPEQRRQSAARAEAEVAVLEGAGHWWMHDAPRPAADALIRFWHGIEAQPQSLRGLGTERRRPSS